jgi:hypothetical protein
VIGPFARPLDVAGTARLGFSLSWLSSSSSCDPKQTNNQPKKLSGEGP